MSLTPELIQKLNQESVRISKNPGFKVCLKSLVEQGKLLVSEDEETGKLVFTLPPKA